MISGYYTDFWAVLNLFAANGLLSRVRGVAVNKRLMKKIQGDKRFVNGMLEVSYDRANVTYTWRLWISQFPEEAEKRVEEDFILTTHVQEGFDRLFAWEHFMLYEGKKLAYCYDDAVLIVNQNSLCAGIRVNGEEFPFIPFEQFVTMMDLLRSRHRRLPVMELAQRLLDDDDRWDVNPPEISWNGELVFRDNGTLRVLNRQNIAQDFAMNASPNSFHAGGIYMRVKDGKFQVFAVLEDGKNRIREVGLREYDNPWVAARTALRFFPAEEVFVAYNRPGWTKRHLDSLKAIEKRIHHQRITPSLDWRSLGKLRLVLQGQKAYVVAVCQDTRGLHHVIYLDEIASTVTNEELLAWKGKYFPEYTIRLPLSESEVEVLAVLETLLARERPEELIDVIF